MISDERCQRCERSRDDGAPDRVVLCKKCYLLLSNRPNVDRTWPEPGGMKVSFHLDVHPPWIDIRVNGPPMRACSGPLENPPLAMIQATLGDQDPTGLVLAGLNEVMREALDVWGDFDKMGHGS